MLNNPFFWLGEVGLLTIIASCFVLIHRLRHQPRIAVVPLLFVLIMALRILVHPVIRPDMHALPADSYLFRFALGLVFATRTWFYQHVTTGITNPDELTDIRVGNKIIKYASIGGGVFLAWLFYKLRSR